MAWDELHEWGSEEISESEAGGGMVASGDISGIVGGIGRDGEGGEGMTLKRMCNVPVKVGRVHVYFRESGEFFRDTEAFETFRRPSGTVLASFRNWGNAEPIYFYDSTGKRIERVSSELEGLYEKKAWEKSKEKR